MAQRGFTLIELITIMILVGIIAVVALPRMSFFGGWNEIGYRDRVKATLEYARKSAVAQRRVVRVTIAGSGLTVEAQQQTLEVPFEPDLAAGQVHPKEVKVRLARELTARFHGQEAAARAASNFEQVFARHELPEEIAECEIAAGEEPVWLPKLLLDAGLVSSTSDGRRMIKQNAVSLDGEKVTDVDAAIPAQGSVLLKVYCTSSRPQNFGSRIRPTPPRGSSPAPR